MKLKTLLLATALAGLVAGAAQAQVNVKIGVLNDRSGLYSDLTGEGSVIAARMAVEDFKAAEKGIKVDIVSADHQNKPDVGSSIARQWYDQDGVDVIVDVPTSSVGLAVAQVSREKS
jgi:branched-chain amino acid transport system substrate-binding protein